MTGRAVVLAIVVGIGAGLHAQQTATFRQTVEGVRLDVRVTDRGIPVSGLRAEDFVVMDNGVEQAVDAVAMRDTPIRVCLLLDTSASVEGAQLAHLTAAASAVVGGLRTSDQMGLFTFALSLKREVDYSDDRAAVDRMLRGVRTRSFTALRDAVVSALQLVPPDDMRTVMLLLTDGIDTGSWLTVDDALNAAAQGDAVLQVVHVIRRETGPVPAAPNPLPPRSLLPEEHIAARVRMLRELARLSGGRYWPTESTASLPATFINALEDMRTRYVLSYSPASPNKPGWHDVKVWLRSRRGDIVVRPRYWVPN